MLALFKWLFIVFAVVGLGAVVLALALAQTDGSSPAPVELNLTAIRDLANAASQDADNMERHAESMASVAAARPDHAHWASEAEIARANARSLRFVADSARAIDRDQTAFPATASAVQLDRLLGDGLNLQGFGQTIMDHATAMSSHIEDMRREAGDDESLLAAISDLGGDVERMEADAMAAISAGKALEEKARALGRSIGVELN